MSLNLDVPSGLSATLREGENDGQVSDDIIYLATLFSFSQRAESALGTSG